MSNINNGTMIDLENNVAHLKLTLLRVTHELIAYAKEYDDWECEPLIDEIVEEMGCNDMIELSNLYNKLRGEE